MRRLALLLFATSLACVTLAYPRAAYACPS